MKYDLNRLNSSDFEYLVQVLSKEILGNGSTAFGDGPDGGREATFNGVANYPSEAEQWSGYWVIQAKYKTIKASVDTKDYEWLRKEIIKEMDKYENRHTKVQYPDNLIFFTNIILTPTAESGSRDKADVLIKQIQNKYREVYSKQLGIAKKEDYKTFNIAIISYDDIINFIDKYRDIAISFSPFILTGDILKQLLDLLTPQSKITKQTNELLCRYLETEFKYNQLSKLEHAGKLTDSKINLEKVFIDLYATQSDEPPTEDTKKFIASTIEIGNTIQKLSLNKASRYVLIAGPGYGKSTLTQFIAQVYRAHFLKNVDYIANPLTDLDAFLVECTSMNIKPQTYRLPFRIVLKEYARWIIDKQNANTEDNISVVAYLTSILNRKSNDTHFTNSIVEELIHTIPSIFIFDGLDEVPQSANRAKVIEEINYFTDILLRRIDADALIIGTSRPQGYTKEFNTYTHLNIRDLNKTDCLEYISKLLKNIEEDSEKIKNDYQILNTAINDNIVGRLMKSPLQASIMTILVRSGGEPPRNKYQLFTDYYTTIFKREKQKNVAKILNEHPEYIDEIHYKLGFTLQAVSESTQNPSASLTRAGYENLIINYLRNDVQLSVEEAKTISSLILEATTERLVFIEEIKDGEFGFNIRSLQEYFAANHYMQNRPDNVISDRLKSIVLSSYWNNTLMFCIGYLFKHKNYTIDHVESICNELNGSTLLHNKHTLTSICKYGSFISLDILNESIFRGHPRFETKFAKLLQHIVSSTFLIKNYEISKLPQKIITDFILQYVEECLTVQDEDKQISGWKLLFYLIKKDLVIDTFHFKSLWPNNPQLEQKILTELIAENILDDDICTQAISKLIANASQIEYYDFIRSLQPEYLLKIATSDNTKAAILLAIIIGSDNRNSEGKKYIDVIIYLSKELTTLLNTLESIEQLNEKSLLTFKEDHFDFEITENYSSEIRKVFSINKSKYSALLSLSSYYNISILSAIYQFYLTPTKNHLRELALCINKYPDSNNRRKIIHTISNTNWIFNKTFNGEFNIDTILSKIDNGEIGSEETWRRDEEMFVRNASQNKEWLCKHSSGLRTITTTGSDIPAAIILRKYLNEVISSPISDDVKNYEIIRLLVFLFFSKDKYDAGKALISENIKYSSALIKVIETHYETDSKTPHYIIYGTSILSKNDILTHYNSINNLCKKITSFHPITYLDHDIVHEIFETVISIIQFTDTSIIRIIPIICSHITIHNNYTGKIQMSINENIDLNRSQENLYSLLCLLILSKNNTDQYENTILKILTVIEMNSTEIKTLLMLIENNSNNNNMDNILQSLNDHIKVEIDYKNRATYLNIVKQHIDSKRSTVILE